MADPGLIKQLVDDGFSPDDARGAIESVEAALSARMRARKSVVIPGVGTLRPAKTRGAYNRPGQLDHLVEKVVVKLTNPAVIEEGTPFPDPRKPARAHATRHNWG